MKINLLNTNSHSKTIFSPAVIGLIEKAKASAGQNMQALAKIKKDILIIQNTFPDATISIVPASDKTGFWNKIIRHIREKFLKIDVSQDYKLLVNGESMGYIRPVKKHMQPDKVNRFHDLAMSVVDTKNLNEIYVQALTNPHSYYIYTPNR